MTAVTRLSDPAGHLRRRATDRPGPGSDSRSASPSGERLLLHSAAQGDAAAWDALVEAHAEQVWAIAIEAGLPAEVAAEVSELVWLRLAQSLDDVADEPVHEWLSRVAAEEATRAARAALRKREVGRPALAVLRNESAC